MALFLIPTVYIIKNEWQGGWSLAAKLLVVTIVAIIAVRIGRECEPPAPLSELLGRTVANSENVADSAPPKGLVGPLVPLMATVATVLWLCFGHRGRISRTERCCAECKGNTTHERVAADHVLLFLIFVTTAAEALLPPAPLSDYHVVLFFAFVSTALMWLPFWGLVAVKVGGWRCRVCGHKEKVILDVGTKLAFGLYVVFMAIVISVYEHVEYKEKSAEWDEGRRAVGRLEQRFSKMMKPRIDQSEAVARVDSQSEKGVESHGSCWRS